MIDTLTPAKKARERFIAKVANVHVQGNPDHIRLDEFASVDLGPEQPTLHGTAIPRVRK